MIVSDRPKILMLTHLCPILVLTKCNEVTRPPLSTSTRLGTGAWQPLDIPYGVFINNDAGSGFRKTDPLRPLRPLR